MWRLQHLNDIWGQYPSLLRRYNSSDESRFPSAHFYFPAVFSQYLCGIQSQLCYSVCKWNTGTAVPTLKSCRLDIEEKKQRGLLTSSRLTIQVCDRERRNSHQAFKVAVVRLHFYSETIICITYTTLGSTVFSCNLFSTLAAKQLTGLPKINAALSEAFFWKPFTLDIRMSSCFYAVSLSRRF